MRMGHEQFFQRFETRIDNFDGKVDTHQRTNDQRWNEHRSDVERFQETSD